MGERVQIGPFSHLRPGAVIEDDVKLGNYAEVKASRVGAGTQMHHFSYVGDADVGARVNIAAGTITVNFDAETSAKSRTVIEDDAAIGSDTHARGAGRGGRGGNDRRGHGRDARHSVLAKSGSAYRRAPRRRRSKLPAT